MDASKLRECANQCNAAADHLEQKGAPGVKGAGAFNWTGLIALLTQVIPEIFTLFGQQRNP